MAKIQNPMAVVQSGGGFPIEKVVSLDGAFNNVSFDDDFEIAVGNVKSYSNTFFNANGEGHNLTIHSQYNGTIYTERMFFNAKFNRVKLDMPFKIDNGLQSTGYIFDSATIDTVDGEIDLSSAVEVKGNAFATNGIKEIRFTKNVCGLNIFSPRPCNFSIGGIVSDDSIVSIINSLAESNPYTVTMSRLTTRLSNLLGRVEMDASNTYHIFVKDDTGTVSAEEFITVTKGWTLA